MKTEKGSALAWVVLIIVVIFIGGTFVYNSCLVQKCDVEVVSVDGKKIRNTAEGLPPWNGVGPGGEMSKLNEVDLNTEEKRTLGSSGLLTACVDNTKEARIALIKNFKSGWTEFEEKIRAQGKTPVLGSTRWDSPNYYQFIGNKRMLIGYEDGHVALASVVEYKCGEGGADFKLLETVDSPLSAPQWVKIHDKYGDENYPAHSYLTQEFKNGGMVYYPDWTEVQGNIFIR